MILSYLAELRSFFLPESIRGYYITPQKLVGLEIYDTAIFATVVSAYGHKKTIIGCYQQDITKSELVALDDQIVDALKKISVQFGTYDQLILSIANNFAIFKEITVPFLDIDTIKMVVPFEVESMIPFALSDAFIDALVTRQDTQARKTTVLVAALKRSTVAGYVTLLEKAGLKPTKFSLHLFEFYSVFKEIPEFHQDRTPTLCVEALPHASQCIAIVDGELVNTRIVPRGYQDARFVQDIQFTLDNFNNALPEEKKIKRILIASTSENKDLINNLHENTGLSVDEFLLYKIVHNNTIKATNGVLLTTPFIGAVGAALDLPYTRTINFLQDEFEPHDNKLLLKQLITAAIFMLMIFGALIIHTQRIQSKIKNEIAASSQEAKTRIIKELDLPEKQVKGRELSGVMSIANTYIKKQEEVWFALSSQNRYSFLHYLQELFRRINPQELGLSLTQLSINENTDTMTLEGEVKGWDELSKLDQELSRPNTPFTLVNHPQQPKFSIKITLDKNYKED